MRDYTQWCDDPFLLVDGDIVQDYAEYSGEDLFEIAGKIRTFQNLTTREYDKFGEDFYAKSKSYVYDILGGNPTAGVRANLLNKFIPRCIENIKFHTGRTFADFGAGVGSVCEIAHTFAGKEVTHIDVAGPLLDFARWRYQKYGWDINVLEIPTQDFVLPQTYDTILTDAVWEHLPSEQQLEYATRLANYVSHNGLLIFLVDLSGPDPLMPMHFPVDIKQVHLKLEEAGMRCETGRDSFASVWTKL